MQRHAVLAEADAAAEGAVERQLMYPIRAGVDLGHVRDRTRQKIRRLHPEVPEVVKNNCKAVRNVINIFLSHTMTAYD